MGGACTYMAYGTVPGFCRKETFQRFVEACAAFLNATQRYTLIPI